MISKVLIYNMGVEENTPNSISTSQCHEEQSNNKINTHVLLNVYDLTPVNNYVYWFGFGIFHSGIEGLSLSLSPCFNFFN